MRINRLGGGVVQHQQQQDLAENGEEEEMRLRQWHDVKEPFVKLGREGRFLNQY